MSPAARTARRARRTLLDVLLGAVRLVGWSALGTGFHLLRTGPALAVAWVAAASVLFLARYAGDALPRARAVLRLRPVPRGAWPVLAAAVPALYLFQTALLLVRVALGWVPGDGAAEREFLEAPAGLVGFAAMGVVLAPLVEEFVFRGWLQRGAERRFGPAPAIAATSLLFAWVHLDSVLDLNRIALGVVFGYAVHATRSLWAGVFLHAAHNATVFLSFASGAEGGADAAATRGWLQAHGGLLPAAAVLAASAAALVWLGLRLRPARSALA